MCRVEGRTAEQYVPTESSGSPYSRPDDPRHRLGSATEDRIPIQQELLDGVLGQGVRVIRIWIEPHAIPKIDWLRIPPTPCVTCVAAHIVEQARQRRRQAECVVGGLSRIAPPSGLAWA